MRAVCKTWACVWATLSIRLSRFDGRLAGMTWDRRASCELGGKGLKNCRGQIYHLIHVGAMVMIYMRYVYCESVNEPLVKMSATCS